MTVIDLNNFAKDSTFYGDLHLLISIKSFELQQIRQRYIQSKNNNPNKIGSVERRKKALGGIAELTISDGRITSHSLLNKCIEPRGIDYKENKFAFSSENIVHVINKTNSTIITNDWFSYIHTVNFSPNGEHVLISSSGFDAIFEYKISSNTKTYEWFAWEHGFYQAMEKDGTPLFLTRKKDIAAEWAASNLNFKLIDSPKEYELPTALRAAFINSVNYDTTNDHTILATFFHEGAVYSINTLDHSLKRIFSNLNSPHGGKPNKNGYMVVSTRSGEIIIDNMVYSFKNLPGKLSELHDMEWIQNAISIHNFHIAIDSNRTSFIIFDIHKKLIDFIPFNPDWAIQDLVEGQLIDEQREIIKRLPI